MSLDISKLENVRSRGDKTTARCPACTEVGHDQKGEHLVINANGSFGCVVYPGDSADAKEHRKRIFALCGDREIKPLAVHPSGLGRLGRVNQSQLAGQPLKTGLLGRLGRVFQTHLEREREPTHRENHNTDEHQRNDCEKGVLAVPSALLRLPFVMVFSQVLGETVFFCEDEDTKASLVEAGADEWSIYTKDELRILVAHNRAKPFLPDELCKLHETKRTFHGGIAR